MTSTNLYINGASTFAGALTFTTASGTSLTSTNAYIANLTVGTCTGCSTGGGGGGVNTSTVDYFAFYTSATAVTGTSFVKFANGALTVTTNTNFTIVSSTSGLFTNATTTNLFATNTLFVSATSTNLYVSATGSIGIVSATYYADMNGNRLVSAPELSLTRTWGRFSFGSSTAATSSAGVTVSPYQYYIATSTGVDSTIDGLSGVAYNPERDTVFVVNNNNTASRGIYELTRDGTYIRKISVSNMYDPEDITWMYDDVFAISLERPDPAAPITSPGSKIVIAKINSSTTGIAYGSVTTTIIDVSSTALITADNDGFEGLAYDPDRDLFYIIKERINPAIYTISRSGTVTSSPFNLATVLTNAGGVTDASSIYFDRNTQHLFIGTDEVRDGVVEVTLQGSIITWWAAPSRFQQLEGIGFTPDGRSLFIVSENAGDATVDFGRYDYFNNSGVLAVSGISDPSTVVVSTTRFTALSMTSTNAFITGLTFTNLSGTSVTTTNLFATNTVFVSATSTNLFGTTVSFTSASGTSLTSTNARILNLIVDSCTGCGGGSAGTSSVSIYVSSSNPGTGTWTAPAGIDYAQVIVTGAGGGGGGAAGVAADTASEVAAGGGGAGGTAIEMLTAATLGSSQSFTLGQGGTAGGDTGTDGGAGGTSLFGAFMTSTGGGAGQGIANAAAGAAEAGGTPGTATGGDINLNGGAGGAGITVAEYTSGGVGGASYWGGGGRGGATVASNVSTAGSNGSAPGSGGGGGSQQDDSTANWAAGGTGANGIVVVISYNSTGGDLAEWYEAAEDVVPGDVVSISSSSLEYDSWHLGLDKTAVLEKAKPGSSVVGIVSTMPFEVMGGDLLGASHNAKPIALAGRVPTKVSHENGQIKAGDKLTISSVPGVAMRATKAGVTVGTALEDAVCEADAPSCKILVLVNTAYSTGVGLKQVMASKGLSMDAIPSGVDFSRIMLANMIEDQHNFTTSTVVSEIFTDRVMAGLEIISPRVVTQNLITDSIETFSGTGLSLNLQTGEAFNIFGINTSTTSTSENTSSTPVITFDSLGNGFFAGKLTANSISANQIEGLNIITNQISLLSSTLDQMNQASSTTSTVIVPGLESGSLHVDGLAEFIHGINVTGSSTFVGDVNIEGNLQLMSLTVQNINSPVISFMSSSLQFLSAELSNATSTLADMLRRLEVNELTLAMFASSTDTSSPMLDVSLLTQGQGLVFENNVMFRGGLQVDLISSITGTTTLMSDVFFFGRPYLNSDSGGYAVVASGTREVAVIFDSEYIEKPVVQATISFRDATTTVSSTEEIILDDILNDVPTSTDWRLLESRENAIFDLDIRFIVTRVSSTGFIIRLNKPAPFDVEFDWLALAVKNPRIFGLVTTTSMELVVPDNLEVSEEIPAEVPQATDSPDQASTTADIVPEINTTTPVEDADVPVVSNDDPGAENPPADEPLPIEPAVPPDDNGNLPTEPSI